MSKLLHAPKSEELESIAVSINAFKEASLRHTRKGPKNHPKAIPYFD